MEATGTSPPLPAFDDDEQADHLGGSDDEVGDAATGEELVALPDAVGLAMAATDVEAAWGASSSDAEEEDVGALDDVATASADAAALDFRVPDACDPSSADPLVKRAASIGLRLLEAPCGALLSGLGASSLGGTALPEAWEEVLGQLAHTMASTYAAVAVCGARNVGKSTLVRLLLNGAMRTQRDEGAVALLDCDLGQPEMGLPGFVSLHVVSEPLFGPPHTHVRPAHASVFVGSASPAADPGLFSSAVARLAIVARTTLPGLSVVVNTCGWTSGLGLQLLADVLAAASPTHVIQLTASSEAADHGLCQLLANATVGAAEGPSIVRLPGLRSPAQPTVGRPPPSAVDARTLQLLSYFGASPRGALALPSASAAAMDSDVWRVPFERLLLTAPFAAPLSALDFAIAGSSRLAYEQSEIASLVDASFVGLSLGGDPGASDASVRIGAHECIGLGLVRAVDVSRGVLLLNTPVPAERLAQVRLLICGTIRVPVALLRASSITAASPYLGHSSLKAAGSAAMKNRSNLVRGPAGGPAM